MSAFGTDARVAPKSDILKFHPRCSDRNGRHMLTIKHLSLDAFLPLQRMRESASAARAAYAHAKPFPHIIFDDFFEPALLDMVLTCLLYTSPSPRD